MQRSLTLSSAQAGRGNKVAPLLAKPDDQLFDREGSPEGDESAPPRRSWKTQLSSSLEFGEHDAIEGNSFYLFSDTNPFRIFLAKVSGRVRTISSFDMLQHHFS